MVGKKSSEKPTTKKDTDKQSANKGKKATSTPQKSKKIKTNDTVQAAPIPERSAVARDALQAFNQQLTRLGFTSVFEVVRRGRTQVVAHLLQQPALGLQHHQAVDFYEQAQTRAASLTRLYAQLCARSEPAMRGLSKLGVHYNRTLMQRSLGGGGNYEDWFEPASGTEFAHPDSVGSLFSPASYLTDLYRAAKPLHPVAHGLQLDNRRPDLGSLTLNDANLHEEISTLALTLEVLDAGVEGDADELLRTTVYPMNLPYNHASERIFQGLAARKNSPVDIWSVLGDFEGAALNRDLELLSWATRMPVAYARDALGMSPELVNILTEQRNTSDASVARYFGHSSLTSMRFASDFQKALKLPEGTILEALGAGPYYEDETTLLLESDPEQRCDPITIMVSKQVVIVPPQTYGARYINGWDDGDPAAAKPFYWYVGAALGQEVPAPINSPSNSGLYNRNGRAFERLNRLVRLQRHVKVLSFAELDWLISQANEDITAHPLTQTLQALAVYMPLRKRYGMTVNGFAACLGVINTFHATGTLSFYRSLFGQADLIGKINISFSGTSETPDATSMKVRAALCQGLQIDDGTLVLLAGYLPGITGAVLPVLQLEHISALYRLVAIPRLFGLSVLEALYLWDLMGSPNAIAKALAQPRPGAVALGVLIRTGYLVDWMSAEQLEPASLVAMTSNRYPVQLTHELKSFIDNIYSTLTGREVVTPERRFTEDASIKAQLARHFAAEFGLKPNVTATLLMWVDAVAGMMNPNLLEYDLLNFWADIQAFCQDSKFSTDKIVQYACLARQFAQVCYWAQLGEQDLALLMPSVEPVRPSVLTGQDTMPTLTLSFLLLLSRYRRWQLQLIRPVAEAREFLKRAAEGDPDLTVDGAAQLLSDLHGWQLEQTRALMGERIPCSFAALLPLLRRMQLSTKLNVSPTNLSLIESLTGPGISQPTLEHIADLIIAAAHG